MEKEIVTTKEKIVGAMARIVKSEKYKPLLENDPLLFLIF